MDSIDAALDKIKELVAAGSVTPYAGRDIVPDLADPAALSAALSRDPVAQAS